MNNSIIPDEIIQCILNGTQSALYVGKKSDRAEPSLVVHAERLLGVTFGHPDHRPVERALEARVEHRAPKGHLCDVKLPEGGGDDVYEVVARQSAGTIGLAQREACEVDAAGADVLVDDEPVGEPVARNLEDGVCEAAADAHGALE